MQRPVLTEWPIWHDDPGQGPQPRHAAAPQRHDIALARYLETQSAHRAATRSDPWATAIHLFSLIVSIGRHGEAESSRSGNTLPSAPRQS